MEGKAVFPFSKACYLNGRKTIYIISLVLKCVTRVEQKAIFISLFLKHVTRVKQKAMYISLVVKRVARVATRKQKQCNANRYFPRFKECYLNGAASNIHWKYYYDDTWRRSCSVRLGFTRNETFHTSRLEFLKGMKLITSARYFWNLCIQTLTRPSSMKKWCTHGHICRCWDLLRAET